MTSQFQHRVSVALAEARRFLQRRRGELAAVAAGAAAAGLVGYGLAHSLAALLPGQTALVGALVALVVTLVALPVALWARTPQARLKLVAPVQPPIQTVASMPLGTLPAVSVAGVPLAAPPATGATPEAQRPVRDALTGAYTQQHFVAAADREWSRIRRHGEDAALLMIDIDRMKGINERFGNDCGDALLIEITRQVSTTLRQYDLLARFGGGVLVVYLPHTDPIGALDVAERIRERVAALRVSWDAHTLRSTVSIGVAAIGASHGALDEVIADAGAALRDAKAAGRNCVRAAPIPPRRSVHPFANGAKRPAGPL